MKGRRALLVNDVERELRRQGWTIVNGGNHRKAVPPGGLAPGQRPLPLSYGGRSNEKLSIVLRKSLKRYGAAGASVLAALDGQ